MKLTVECDGEIFKLLKDAECYTPDYIGRKDILIVLDRIAGIGDGLEGGLSIPGLRVFNCDGLLACPGFIDQHVHITGGGGEGGPGSLIPEIAAEEILSAGVSTVVGILGLDGLSRSMAGLLAKARSLETQGLNTYIYTGNYGIPTVTLTGKVITDITYIDKVVGVGELAISDPRSSHPSLESLRELAWEACAGGMLAAKAGVMHIHVGDGKRGLGPLLELVEESDFPMEMFVPTHINRNRELFRQGVEYAAKGGNIDLTAGEVTGKGFGIADAAALLLDMGIDMEKITFTSDGNGSMPGEGGGRTSRASVGKLFSDVRACINQKGIPLDMAIRPVTCNAAKRLKLYPEKGALMNGSCADILLLRASDLLMDKLFVKGRLMADGGRPLKVQ